MNIRELTAKIGFEIDEKPLEKLEKLVEGVHRRLELLAGAELAHKLFEMSESFAHWGSEILTTAESLGLATDALQELRFAAEKSGIGAEEMSHSLAILSKRIYAVQSGGSQAKEALTSFIKAGFSPQQVAKFENAQQALMAFSDIIKNTESPIKRTGLAMDFLGRGSAKFVTFLSQGSKGIRSTEEEMKRLGLVLSKGQLKALEETEYGFQKLFAVLHSIGAVIASTIGPAFTFIIEKFLDFYAANRKIIETNISKWLISFAGAMGFVAGLVVGLAKKLIRLAKKFNIEGDILKFVGWVAGAASALTGMGIAFNFLAAAFSGVAAFSTFGLVLAGIAVAAHDVMAAMNHEPTWVGKVADWVTKLGSVNDILQRIRHGSATPDVDSSGYADNNNLRRGVNAEAALTDDDRAIAFGMKLGKAIDVAMSAVDTAAKFGKNIGVAMAEAFWRAMVILWTGGDDAAKGPRDRFLGRYGALNENTPSFMGPSKQYANESGLVSFLKVAADILPGFLKNETGPLNFGGVGMGPVIIQHIQSSTTNHINGVTDPAKAGDHAAEASGKHLGDNMRQALREIGGYDA